MQGIKPQNKRSLGKRRVYRSREFISDITVAKNNKGGVLLLAHSKDIEDPTYAYSFRWGIELGFKAMKSGGFNMEDTK
jgi:IS4 transposase